MEPCPDENALAALAHALVERGEHDDLEQHLDRCPSCRMVLAELVSPGSGEASPAPIGEGASVGRYHLLKLLGAGSMGVVYLAHDPELHRRVALKLHHSGIGLGNAAAQARLLNEARALARLSHENVITVHDVGVAEGQLYIAIEPIDGLSARAWQEGGQRSWREVLRVYLAAGQGLAAAHRAGLLHRDFKPDNVLCGHDGRVVVMDFGLAGAGGEGAGAADASEPALPLTATGAVLGSPAYMPPERLRGGPATERSDLYSFCVALFEALCGERPFAGRTLAEHCRAAESGRVRPPGCPVPAGLFRIIARGLSPDPAGRFPSMDVLLAALSIEFRPWWRRPALVGAALALLLLVAVGWRAWVDRPAEECRALEHQLGDLWPGSTGEAVRAAFFRRGAETAFQTIVERVNAQQAAYVRQSVEDCLAARATGVLSETGWAQRRACLDRRRYDLRAFVAILSEDSIAPEGLLRAAHALRSTAWCGGTEVLRSHPLPPERERAEVDETRRWLSSAKVLIDAGAATRGLSMASDGAARARQLHHPPLLAEALLVLGAAQHASGNAAQADATLAEALWTAEAAGHDEVVAWAWVKRAEAAIGPSGPAQDNSRWLRFARAAIGRIGGDVQLQSALDALAAPVR